MKDKKGFTLIELLAVIVILGLLMAIAIPSVTKYITESRKKTVVSTIGNYMTAMVNEVNDLTYTFMEANTIYAVPIECIALERGGTNPFGAWHQASNAYGLMYLYNMMMKHLVIDMDTLSKIVLDMEYIQHLNLN